MSEDTWVAYVDLFVFLIVAIIFGGVKSWLMFDFAVGTKNAIMKKLDCLPCALLGLVDFVWAGSLHAVILFYFQ